MTRSIDDAIATPSRHRKWLNLSVYALAAGALYVHYEATVTGADSVAIAEADAELLDAVQAPIPDMSVFENVFENVSMVEETGVPDAADMEPIDAGEDATLEETGFEEEEAFVDESVIEDGSTEDDFLEVEEQGFIDDGGGFIDEGFAEEGFEDAGFEGGGFVDDFEAEKVEEVKTAELVPARTASLTNVVPPPRTRPRHSPGSPEVLEGRLALMMNLLLLEKGYRELAKVPSYTATFFKQERFGDDLGEGQVIQVKLRHEPFSVYLHWLVGDKGREVLYVEGENDGDMIAHPGGWKGRMLPAIRLDPKGAIALRESRHPVTNIGLLELARHGIEICKHNLSYESGVACRLIDKQTFDNRPCYLVMIEHESPQTSPDYRKLVVFIDEKLSVPVAVRNYGWPQQGQSHLKGQQLDEATLVENYSYSSLRIEPQLAEADFDENNRSYKFRR